MTYGVAIFRDNTYEIYEKHGTSELADFLHTDIRGLKNLVICRDYKARGYHGDVIPYNQWSRYKLKAGEEE